MLKSYKSSLQLNSYKLDTRGYEQKLKETALENQELKSIIEQNKLKEDRLIEELRNVKIENATLRNKLTSNPSAYEPRCRNCGGFGSQGLDRVATEVETERSRAKEYKDMYENELQNKKELTEYYEKKLHFLLKDKDMQGKYEDKAKVFPQKEREREVGSATSLSQNIRYSAQETPAINTARSIKKIPPSPPKSNNFKPAFANPKPNPPTIDDTAIKALRTPPPTQSNPSSSD